MNVLKLVFYAVCIVLLPAIVYFQYESYNRFHGESVYAFPVSNKIDMDYHDPDSVLRYLELSEQIPAFGRNSYQEHGVDVRQSNDGDPDAAVLSKRYQSMVASARFLGAKLERSAELKEQGMSNEDILREESGINQPESLAVNCPPPPAMPEIPEFPAFPAFPQIPACPPMPEIPACPAMPAIPECPAFPEMPATLPESLILAKMDDEGHLVLWVQNKLESLGTNLNTDGIFLEETRGSLRDFQQQQGLPVTGHIDVRTLIRLKEI